MVVTKITTHITDGLNRLLAQYKGQPNLTAAFTAFIEQFQEIEDATYDIDTAMQLWDGTETPALGSQLDAIGEIVGISRNGLPDDEYILFIFGKIAENFSDSTVQAIGTVVSYLYAVANPQLFELYPAAIAFEVTGSTIPTRLWKLALGLVANSIGGGITLAFGAASMETDVFSFDGPNSGPNDGFGDANDPSVGGVFIELIE